MEAAIEARPRGFWRVTRDAADPGKQNAAAQGTAAFLFLRLARTPDR
ncbi:MAG: hypothetical protein QM691_11420 [Opitutaceae bacterium]